LSGLYRKCSRQRESDEPPWQLWTGLGPISTLDPALKLNLAFKIVRFNLMLPQMKPARHKMRMLPLVAATYFMVSGGPYGIEDILGGAGFGRAILILLALPIFWSLPTALMIGELAGAIPAEGGFYVWVRRAMGSFWGYQESWLSLAASIFDMALYPSIFSLYLGVLSPALTAGWRDYAWKLAVVVLCTAWNLRGAPEVGEDSVKLGVLLLAPFVVFVVVGVWRCIALHPAISWSRPASGVAFSTAMLVALWNYMGWDNASTVAREVHNPQRSYPRAMIGATIFTAISYVLPLLAMALAGLSPDGFTTGSWATAGGMIGGTILATAIVAGGIISGVGMFNALMMSYTRLPVAMAADGMLPRVLMRRNRRGVPWVSVVVCSVAWALALNLPFERLISMDLVLYGSSLILEFVALVVLRIREPQLERPFKAGNLFFACLLGICPTVLIGYAMYVSRDEKIIGNLSSFVFSGSVALAGPLLYWLTSAINARRPASISVIE
jgi:amino acid transporter